VQEKLATAEAYEKLHLHSTALHRTSSSPASSFASLTRPSRALLARAEVSE